MCKKIYVITKECEPDGHEVEAEVCWRQCASHADRCRDGDEDWNTHCENSIVDPNYVDYTHFTLVCDDVEKVSREACGLCTRTGDIQELASYEDEQIRDTQTRIYVLETEIARLQNLVNHEQPLTDQERSRLESFRGRLQQCREQLRRHQDRLQELEILARNSHHTRVREAALANIDIPGDPDTYYYGHQGPRGDGYHPEGVHRPRTFPPDTCCLKVSIRHISSYKEVLSSICGLEWYRLLGGPVL